MTPTQIIGDDTNYIKAFCIVSLGVIAANFFGLEKVTIKNE